MRRETQITLQLPDTEVDVEVTADYQPPERECRSDWDGGYPGCGPCLDVERLVEALPCGVHGPRREWGPADISAHELGRIEDELLEEVRLDDADRRAGPEYDPCERLDRDGGCLWCR